MLPASLIQNGFCRNVIALILVAGLCLPGSVWAWRNPGQYPKLGKRVGQMPAGCRVVRAGAHHYHYHAGVFYRKGPNGFAVVRAPMGAVVARLPAGFLSLVVGGIAYFTFAGVYYRKAPSGYVVVDVPATQTETAVAAREVTVAVLNVRSGPGMHHPVSTQVNRGDRLEILGQAPGWYFVRLPEGAYGWVMARYTGFPMPDAKG